MEKNRWLRWVWWNISCSTNERSIGSGLKVSNDHPFDLELEDEGTLWGRSEMYTRWARFVIWIRTYLKSIWNTSIVKEQLGMNLSGMEFENVERSSWKIGVQNILLTFPSKVEFFSNVK